MSKHSSQRIPRARARFRRASRDAVLALAACLSGAEVATAADVPTRTGLEVTQAMVADMFQASEVLPAGAPGWSAFPRLNYGDDPRGFEAFVPWGQLYRCKSGNPQPQARVQLASLRAWILNRRGVWWQIRADDPVQGFDYREDFANNSHVDADDRVVIDPDLGRTVSVRNTPGRTFHFVTGNARVPIDPDDISGVAVYMVARLVPGSYDPAAAAPCLTLSVGADYWRTINSPWDGLNNNDDVGIGRFKRVDAGWRGFSMITLPRDWVTRRPLPFRLPVSVVR